MVPYVQSECNAPRSQSVSFQILSKHSMKVCLVLEKVLFLHYQKDKYRFWFCGSLHQLDILT